MLVRRRPHGRKPGLRPLPKRAQAPPPPRRRAAGARGRRPHPAGSASGHPDAAAAPPLPDNSPALAQPRVAALQVSIRTPKFNLEGGGGEEGLPPQRARAPIPRDIVRKRSASQPPPGRAGPAAPASQPARRAKWANRFGQRLLDHQGVIVAFGSQHCVPPSRWAERAQPPRAASVLLAPILRP